MMNSDNLTQAELLAEVARLRQENEDLIEKQGQIERAKQEWEITADSLPQLICLLDTNGRILRTNLTVEHWDLATVTTVSGKTVSQLLHPGHSDSYFDMILKDAWPGLTRDEAFELEIEDKILGRFFHVQLQPISMDTGRQSKATESSFAALILHDVTARKQAERLKNEFLANISQELQNPLNSIIGYSQMMLAGVEGDLTIDVHRNIQAIHESGQSLLQLINEILDLAELETGTLSLATEDLAVAPLLEQIKDNHQAMLGDKQIDIAVVVEPDLPSINADKLRLGQIVNHLVANAVHFTPAGQIELRASQKNKWLQIEVEDSGVGIEPNDLDIIFEKFRQVDGSLSRSIHGTGLGLTITRHLVELHGGKISVQSRVDEGTTFTIQLPLM